MIKYIIGILLSISAMLYCTGLDNIKEKMKKPYTWIFFVSMLTIAMLTMFYYEQSGNSLSFCVTLIFLFICVYVDVESCVISNKLILFFFLASLLVIPFNPSVSWREAAIGFIGTAVIFATISFISKGALGMGDAKLMSVVGLILGWKMFLTVVLIAIVASVLTGVFLLMVKRKKRDYQIPFSPFILTGVIVCILL